MNHQYKNLLLSILFLAGCVSDLEESADPIFGAADLWDTAGPELSLSIESELEHTFDEVIMPYYQTGIQSSNNAHSQFVVFPSTGAEEIAALVIVNGRTESHCKWAEVLYDLRFLRDLGISIYALDHRGQGFSPRLLPDEPDKGHIEDFQHYVDDLDELITNHVRRDNEDLPVLGLAHSMGGAVMTKYAMLYPDSLEALVLTSPMIEINFGSMNESVTYYTVKALFADSYILGGDVYDSELPFEGNEYTHSENRFNFGRRVFQEERYYPYARIGSPTNGWIEQSILADQWIRENAEGLSTPTLLFQAMEDTIVLPDAQTDLCNAAEDCQRIELPGSRHEVFMEIDDTRSFALRTSLEFLLTRVPSTK